MRFRLNIALLLAGIILTTAIASLMFVYGWWAQACLALIASAACIISVFYLQSRLISTMSSFVKALEMNDTTMRVKYGGDSELKSMSESMNRISELYHENMRELQTRKIYYDRVLKVMTHEMRNGITPIVAISADMKSHPERYQGLTFDDTVNLLNSQADGMRRLLDSYYNLTHLPDPEPEDISAGEYFRSLRKIINTELDRRGLPGKTVRYTIAEDMTLTIDPSLMNQVMINLLRNALDALPFEGGTVNIVLSISDSRPYLTISDNGSGIPQNAIDSLFTPFFTTKPNGSGVGLAVCRQIIRKHGGEILINSLPQKGTIVAITL